MTTWVSQYQKGKTSLDLNEERDDEVWGCSGISWTICKQYAPQSRQISHQHLITLVLCNHQYSRDKGVAAIRVAPT